MNNNVALIVYFSHAGQNYSHGRIVDLKKGNTHVAAEMIAESAGAELFEIRAKNDDPFLYGECTCAAKRELLANSRPGLAQTIDASGYETIIPG